MTVSLNQPALATNGAPAKSPSHRQAMPGNEQRRVELSHLARTRPAAGIRTLFPKEKMPGMISLLAGKPNEKSFPFKAITIDSKGADGQDEKLTVEGEELAEALNYGLTPGITGLVQWLMEFQARAHNRPIGPDWRLNMGAGSQDLIIKVSAAWRYKMFRIFS